MRQLSRAGKDIRRVRDAAEPVFGKYMLAWAGPADEEPWAAFLVGRRVGKAHDRNRVKRRIREALRTLEPNRPVVIIARTEARNATFRNLHDELTRLLPRACREIDESHRRSDR